MFTLPCSTGISSGSTVFDILGDDLDGTYAVDWIVYERDTANDSYDRMALGDDMHTGRGYWVYTTQAAQTVDVVGQYNGSPDLPLKGVPGGLANLVGHPFDFSVDWSDVQIVDGAEVQSLAAAVADGDLSETYHIANGNGYNAYDASTPGMIGTLNEFDGIWVKAYKDDIYLRVPSITAASPSPPQSASDSKSASKSENHTEGLSGGSSTGTPEAPANTVAEDGSWFVRLTVESGIYKDSGNVLGQLPDSEDGLDKHDLEELAPFGDKLLTIIFPHDEWGSDAWGFTSDYHAVSRQPGGEWLFAVYASEDVTQASLRLEGPVKILKKAHLRDLETGKLVKFSKGDYYFDMSPGIHYFSFQVGNR